LIFAVTFLKALGRLILSGISKEEKSGFSTLNSNKNQIKK
jgi:hypothetical protein